MEEGASLIPHLPRLSLPWEGAAGLQGAAAGSPAAASPPSHLLLQALTAPLLLTPLQSNPQDPLGSHRGACVCLREHHPSPAPLAN